MTPACEERSLLCQLVADEGNSENLLEPRIAEAINMKSRGRRLTVIEGEVKTRE